MLNYVNTYIIGSCLSLKSISSLFQFVGDLTLSLSLLFMQDTSGLGQVSQSAGDD